MKKNIIKKLFILIARKLGLELIEQSNLKFINEDNNKKSIVIPLGKVKLTRKVSDLLIIFRTNIDILIWDQNKKRIFEADKIEYSKRCLISLIKSMKSLSSLRNDIKLKLLVIDNSLDTSDNNEFKNILNKSVIDYKIINHKNNTFKKKDELKEVFLNHGINFNEKLAFSCGSGITACVLGLASTIINNKLPVIYDGSWAEYGLK